MAKGKKDLEEELAKLKMELQMEKEFTRKVLGEAPETPLEKLRPRWSTEWMQDEADKCDLINGAITKVYDQHVFKIDHAKNNVVEIRYHNGKRAKSNPLTYKKVKFVLQPEAFFLLLELMKFAEQEFDMDQKNVVDKMTSGEGIKIRRIISGLW
jgi:hypothetical protein